MPTVTKTWVFAADAEGLADAGVSANIAFAYEGADGDPASGCVKFTSASVPASIERARRAATGQTWETWGVPAGATVTNVQITAWRSKVVAESGGGINIARMRIVDSAAASVHSAGDLISSPVGAPATWITNPAGSARAVNALSQASTTDVRLEIEYETYTTGTNDVRFDTITLAITYVGGGSTSMAGIFNPTDLDWSKGYMYVQAFGGNKVACGVLQEISFADAYTTEKMMGPTKLTPEGVGISERSVSGSARWGKVRTPQFEALRGGSDAYSSPDTTYTALVDSEPSNVFDLHVMSPLSGADFQAYFYNCLATNLSTSYTLNNWVYLAMDFECYGQAGAAGLLYKILELGDQTTSN